jgi:hypothetical protein
MTRRREMSSSAGFVLDGLSRLHTDRSCSAAELFPALYW